MSPGQRQARVRRVQQALHLPFGRLPQPTLILICGLPGTGKSFLAQKLAGRMPLVIVASDQVRRLLFDKPTYTPDEHFIVHSTCQGVVAALLRSGHSVVVDATNLTHRSRQRYYAIAEECRAGLLILQTTAPQEVVQQRLRERSEGRLPDHGSEAGWDIYLDYAEKMEPIRRPHRVVDTSKDMDAVVEEIAHLLEGTPAPLPPCPRARMILNPAAGQTYRLADLDETIGYLVRRGWELSLRETRQPNEAAALAREAAAEGWDLVVAIGGDGTVNEVVNGLAGTNTALAVLPMGSGNGWAREQGLPLEPVEAARVLAHGQIRSADLGLAGTRYFLLMASAGFDAAVVQAMTQETGPALWPWNYLLKGVALAADFSGQEAAVTLDDHRIDGAIVLVVVGNTRLYGGLVHITHHASIDDGLLDVLILRGRGGLPQISHFALVTLLRQPDRMSGVDYYRVREVSISSETPFYVQTDGELIGTTPMTFQAVPRALQVLVPQNLPPGLFSHP